MPRPFLLTEAKKRHLLRQVMDGATVQQAARDVGCCSRTVRRAALREPEFAWRLQTARQTGAEIKRRANCSPLLSKNAATVLLMKLEQELRRRWFDTNGGDTTATPVEATT